MKNKKIILISLLFILAIISIGSVVAADNDEINIIDEDSSIITDDIVSTDITNDLESNDTNNINSNNLESADTNLNSNDLESADTNNPNSNDLENNNLEIAKDLKTNKNSLKSNKVSSTITVDGSAYNQMSTPSIQNAIDSASAGDTIIITGTSYVHCHFIVDKQLTIISEVGTVMTPCPSNTRGSGSHGLFYFSPDASGSVLMGFTLNNDLGDEDDYGAFIRGAENVQIINCTASVSDGDAVRIENAKNIAVTNSTLTNSNIGVRIICSEKTTIKENNISYNKLTGVLVGDGNLNTTIMDNNITYNKATGINMSSGDYVYVLSNMIAFNQNPSTSSGSGVYVNSNITKIEIKGNYIRQNGQYGVLNDYRARNMDASKGAEKLETIENNYFMGHTERLAYHIQYSSYNGGPFIYDADNDLYIFVGEGKGNWDIGKTVVYLGYTYYIDETICGATLYKAPNTAWGSDNYKLKLSEITEDDKGVYSVSILDNNGKIASDLSSIYVTFYLNKNNSNATPQDGDVYRTVLMKNGTATADFRDEDFLETGNTIIASFPGMFELYTINPYVKFNVPDEDIPGTYSDTEMIVSDTILVPSSGDKLLAKLVDKRGNPVVNRTVTFKIDGLSKSYTKTTDENGTAFITINLAKQKTYKYTVSFDGDENYNKSMATANLIIAKQSPQIISSNMALLPASGERFIITLKDLNNKPIANKTVKFTISSKTYTKTTDEKGTAFLTINLVKEKSYAMTIQSPATSQYKSVTKSNVVIIKTGANQTKISASDMSLKPRAGEKFIAILSDKNGNPLANKTVTFTVSSKTYTKTTDENGTAFLTINLVREKTYSLTTKFYGDEIYSSASLVSKIKIGKESYNLETYDRTYISRAGQLFTAKLTNSKGEAISGAKISFTVSSKTYNKTTDDEGIATLTINLVRKTSYKISSKFAGDSSSLAISKSNTIRITDEIEKSYVDKNLGNAEIQRIIDEAKENYDVEFLGASYDDINLTVNKSLAIYTNSNSTLNGKDGASVFTINNLDLASISFFNINPNSATAEGNGIVINNSKEVAINKNTIKNSLDSSKMDDYNNGSTILPGYGIWIINSENTLIDENSISSFESGIYFEDSDSTVMRSNTISENNYGIKSGFGNENTEIIGNTIIDNIGWYTEEVPEGPRGYGIFLNNSAVNISINENNVSNNYIGISIDANNSTGIIITSNLIADNSLEGIRFNEGYDLALNVVEPIVTDNAIYRNAEGPSLMILGEMSANPNGIYGAGEWNDSLKLSIGPNWYGVNNLRTWDNATGIVGVGTMCPRIKTTTIQFTSLESESPGSYKINFYKNGELAKSLAKFDIYATINRGTESQEEVHFWIENGTGSFSFNKENYIGGNNKIEISVGSLIHVIDRLYSVVYTYEVPESEIPA
ncbi:right-handed parallel beta-helix repeat-containing protein [uncultured Methanobrevibacter sp.]|uniref:right-handed parallel beta-helix repeat-containing protein n=1 Tax=uncultured Methanobrevibacter sp. TaxID=253161 RepID=UPI002621225A